MGLMWFLANSTFNFLLYSLFTFTVINCFASVQPAPCHEAESSALLQFKQSFVISKFASENPLSFPKTDSWIPSSDCCSWLGVKCDEQTGHVIDLNISSSQIYGSIGANSSLFNLSQLQRLNLSDNHFNYSQIPSRFALLSRLTHLDFSRSKFSGEIPEEISQLSNLLVLELCCNYIPSYPSIMISPLYLKQRSLRSIVQNLTSLQVLSLTFVDISSPVPSTLSNLSSLRYLSLWDSGVYGEFPIRIFHLPNLNYLYVGENQGLTGYLPEFHSSGPLQFLSLRGTSFQGNLPASIGNLNALIMLDVGQCMFTGSIPSSLSNLTKLMYLNLGYNHFKGNLTSSLSNLTQLTALSFGDNDITSVDISWIGKLNRLSSLDLSSMNIGSQIPNSFANLTRLSYLAINSSNLLGQIPAWIMNFSNLYHLDLSGNKLHGTIPHSIFSLEFLSLLYLGGNHLVGQLELNTFFLSFKGLTDLYLSYNNLSLLTNPSPVNASLAMNVRSLFLASCNMNKFPELLKDQDQLEQLDLSSNKIHDTLPSWIQEKENLWILLVSNNMLVGGIPPWICNVKSLEFLELSYNNLSGIIPPCLGTFSKKLQTLKLGNNQLFGFIPQTFMKGSALKMIDFSQNNLQGQLPEALGNCRMLEYLDVSNNQINGSFPFWLGNLPELKVLVLRSNMFSGVISSTRTCTFPKLHIIDLSQNDFSGNLPSELIQNWETMRASNMNQIKYELWYHYYKEIGGNWAFIYHYSFTIFNKGKLMVYEKLQQLYFFIAIDLSSNKLGGEIPENIGDLKGLVLLNLSNNLLSGGIPSSLGKLSQLEALDLSHNILSGKIPQELTQLNFLEFLNLSYNDLSGPVPQNPQFDTFESNSFEGNRGLCGMQLLKKCEDHHGKHVTAPPSASDEDEESLFEFDWKVIVIGYGGGLAFGLAMGSTYISEKHAVLLLRRLHIRRV